MLCWRLKLLILLTHCGILFIHAHKLYGMSSSWATRERNCKFCGNSVRLFTGMDGLWFIARITEASAINLVSVN